MVNIIKRARIQHRRKARLDRHQPQTISEYGFFARTPAQTPLSSTGIVKSIGDIDFEVIY
jgi:hypothetical protein